MRAMFAFEFMEKLDKCEKCRRHSDGSRTRRGSRVYRPQRAAIRAKCETANGERRTAVNKLENCCTTHEYESTTIFPYFRFCFWLARTLTLEPSNVSAARRARSGGQRNCRSACGCAAYSTFMFVTELASLWFDIVDILSLMKSICSYTSRNPLFGCCLTLRVCICALVFTFQSATFFSTVSAVVVRCGCRSCCCNFRPVEHELIFSEISPFSLSISILGQRRRTAPKSTLINA